MSENKAENPRSEANRTRSPNYPCIALGEAINRTKMIYEKEHNHKTSAEVVAQAMGYNGLNGTSRTVTSALKKYGLVLADGDGLKVSDEAIDILLLESNDPRSIQARVRAALRPPLFAEFRETYKDKLPSDASLTHSLVKKGFNPRMAGDVIRIYKETLESLGEEGRAHADEISLPNSPAQGEMELGLFSNPSDAFTQRGSERVSQPSQNGSAPETVQPSFSSTPVSATTSAWPPASVPPPFEGMFTDALEYRIAGAKVRMLFEGKITRESIEKLIKHLNLDLDEYPSQAESKPVVAELIASAKESVSEPKLDPAPAGSKGFKEVYDRPRLAIWHSEQEDQEVTIAGYAGEKDGRHFYFTDSQTGIPADELEFFDDLEN